MAQLLDTFTGTADSALNLHTSDSGNTWSPATGSNNGDIVISNVNTVRNNSAGNYPTFLSNWTPSSAQYDITATVTRVDYSSPANAAFGFVARHLSNGYCYSCDIIGAPSTSMGNSNTIVAIGKTNSSGSTWLAAPSGWGAAITTPTFTYVDNALWRFRILNGTQDVSYSTNGGTSWTSVGTSNDTDSALTGAGSVGIVLGISASDSAGFQMDNLQTSFNTPQTLAPDSTGIVLSPGNQYVNPGTYLEWIFPSTSAKFNFSGTSLAATLDLTPLTTGSGSTTTGTLPISTSLYPSFYYSIDGGTWSNAQITTSPFTFATGLSSGTHTAEIRYQETDNEIDTWTPHSAVRITGWTVDGGSSISAPTGNATARAKKAMIMGDSITHGYAASPPCLMSYGVLLGQHLNAEMGVIGYSGQGWGKTASSVAPAFTGTWNYYNASHQRTTWPTLDYLLIAQGTNDGGTSSGTLTSAITSTLPSIRTAIGSTAIIVIVIPPSGQQDTTITAAVNSYISTNADGKCLIVDLSTRNYGFGTGSASQYSNDGTHPTTEGHAIIAGDIAAAIKSFEGSLTSGTIPTGQVVTTTTGTIILGTGAKVPYEITTANGEVLGTT